MKKIKLSLCCLLGILAVGLVYYNLSKGEKLFSPTSRHVTNTDISKAKSTNGLRFIEDSTSNCLCLEVFDSLLVAVYQDNDAVFRVYDTNSGREIGRFGKIGNASNELLHFPSSFFCRKDTSERLTLCFADLNRHVTRVVDLNKSMYEGNLCLIKDVKHKINTYEYNAFLLPDDRLTYFASIGYVDARDNIYFPPYIQIGNVDNGKRLDLYPRLCKNKYEVYYTFYSTVTGYCSDNGKFVQAYNTMDMFNVIDQVSGRIDNYAEEGSYGFEDVENLSSLNAAKNFARVCYLDVAVGKDCFHLLYDGRQFTECEKKGEGAKFIKTFDWTGNLLQINKVSERLMRIAYDDKNEILYALDVDGNIFKYKL